MDGEQDAVFTLLCDPATHGLDKPIKRIDTNAAAVFLAGGDAYKVKRAVRYPFMDQSTLAKRHAACETEIAVNRRYAPGIYRGLVPIVREADGSLHLGNDGEIVEWAVHMKRFDENDTLDHVAERGDLRPGLIKHLAAVVVDGLAIAEERDGVSATDALAGVVDETTASLVEHDDVFSGGDAEAFRNEMTASFEALRPLLLKRGEKGYVRRCHGDLHLRNVALIDGKPTLFDAIEFDESIATIDILYDLAFLLMDLWERGYHYEANLLLNRVLWKIDAVSEALEGLAAMPLFLALRAAVRAKVEALRFLTVGQAPDVRVEARRYFDQAVRFLEPTEPMLVAIGGYSGTGKTMQSRALAPRIGRAPGAIHLRSDIERKRLMEVDELDRLPASAYRKEITDRVFATLRDQAAIGLTAGQSVIVDAVHKTPEERDLIAEVAKRAGVRFRGLWLTAPVEVLIGRINHRRADASDADEAVVLLQADQPSGSIDWTAIDTTGSLEAVTEAALREIRRDG